MNKLVSLSQTKLGMGYIWGSSGEQLTPKKLQWFKDVLGEEHYELSDGTRAEKWIGSQVFDCSGLIQWCLQKLGYMQGVEKQSAESFYSNYCTPVSKTDLHIGDLVFIRTASGEINHIGIYKGHGKTIEAMGTKYGVVEGDISRFNLFGRLKFTGLEDIPMDWKQIIKKVSDSPDRWERAINTAVQAAKADGNMGDLEILAFLPTLIEKVYNCQK